MRNGCLDSANRIVCALSWLLLPAFARAELGVPISSPAPVNTNAGADSGNDAAPSIATDGQGLWIAVWQSSDSLGNTIGTDLDILFARSIDSGANWSSPAPLNSNAAIDSNANFGRDDRMPSIATDGLGHWVVVWRLSTPPFDPEIFFARSIDNGATWSSPAVLNTNSASDSADDSNPVIATDRKGVWITVWHSRVNPLASLDSDILYARSADNGATWSAPLPLNADAAAHFDPQIATDSQGRWIVVWDRLQPAQTTAVDCLFARSIDNGATWSPPAFLNVSRTTAAQDSLPAIASGGAGRWVAAWSSNNSLGGTIGGEGDLLVARTLDDGDNWSLPIPLNSYAAAPNGSEDYGVRLTADRDGNWVAVWGTGETVGSLTGDNVLIARSIDDGASWSISAPLNINAPGKPGQDSSPFIATDGRGEWVGVWVGGTGVSGNDADILAAHFGLPDCNQNLIGDPLETAAGISPDINNNGVPDVCDALFLPPARNGCGGGPCGVGAAAFAPLTLLAMTRMGRSPRRKREGESNE